MLPMLQIDNALRDLTLFPSPTVYIDSGATVHVMQAKSIWTGNASQSIATNSTTGKDTIKTMP